MLFRARRSQTQAQQDAAEQESTTWEADLERRQAEARAIRQARFEDALGMSR